MGSVRKSLWFQFRFQFLFAAVTFVAILLGVWVSWIAPSRRQLETVSQIRRLQGEVSYGTPSLPLPLPLTEFRDYVQPVTEVNLADARLTGEDLQRVARLPHVIKLSLASSNTTDAMIAELISLRGLKELDLTQTQVDARALGYLKQLPRLRRLNLQGTTALTHFKKVDASDPEFAWMTDKENNTIWESQPEAVAILNLQEMKELEFLDLSETSVTDADLAKLVTLRNLRALRLANTQISDYGVYALRSLSNLQVLDLTGTRASGRGLHCFKNLRQLNLQYCREVSDEVLPEIGTLQHLEWLDLSHTGYRNVDGTAAQSRSLSFTKNRWERLLLRAAGFQDSKPLVVTDAGLTHLHSLRQLRAINLQDTYASECGVEELQQVMPDAAISYSPD